MGTCSRRCDLNFFFTRHNYDRVLHASLCLEITSIPSDTLRNSLESSAESEDLQPSPLGGTSHRVAAAKGKGVCAGEAFKFKSDCYVPHIALV
jgi:hypothetical protein